MIWSVVGGSKTTTTMKNKYLKFLLPLFSIVFSQQTHGDVLFLYRNEVWGTIKAVANCGTGWRSVSLDLSSKLPASATWCILSFLLAKPTVSKNKCDIHPEQSEWVSVYVTEGERERWGETQRHSSSVEKIYILTQSKAPKPI